MKVCFNCGFENEDGSQYCGSCGCKISDSGSGKTTKLTPDLCPDSIKTDTEKIQLAELVDELRNENRQCVSTNDWYRYSIMTVIPFAGAVYFAAHKEKNKNKNSYAMIDPHTGNYVTIKHDKNTCTAEELPEGAKTADFTNEQFIYHKLGKNADEKTMEAAVSSEIKRLREIQKKIKRNMDAAVRKSSQPDNAGEKRNVTDSVTNRIPDTIEDGIVNYFDSLDEKARELINNAIENNMPDIFIRQMFTMDYESMKEFYEEYFK